MYKKLLSIDGIHFMSNIKYHYLIFKLEECDSYFVLDLNMEGLISIINSLNDRSVSFHRIQENITVDKSSSTGQLLFHLFAAFAEFKRNFILERSEAGRVVARARGRLGGRSEKLNESDLKLLKALVDNGTPIKTITERWNVSRTTIYCY